MSENILTQEFSPFQKWKVLCWHKQMEAIPTGNFMPPVNIALDMIQGTAQKKKCAGLRCNFCMSNFEEQGKEASIPKVVLLEIPKFYHDWGVLSVCLAGHHSDQLTYDHDAYAEFVRLLFRNDVEAGLVTNGILLNDALIQETTRYCAWTGFSVNAGTRETFAKQTGAKPEIFDRIIENIAETNEYCDEFKLPHTTGYKMLITDENHLEIIDAIRLAKELGCRQIQIRPSELPIERSQKIDVKAVEEQLIDGLSLEVPGEFEVFGIREKFTPDFKKKPPKRCIASPLGSTWMADGNIVICPDRRWSAHLPNMTLGNFITEGFEAVRRKWGGPEHKAMIAEANKQLDKCIRCTAYSWHQLYEKFIASDPTNKRLI